MGWSPLVERSRLYDTARTTTDVKALAVDGQDSWNFVPPILHLALIHASSCMRVGRTLERNAAATT